MWAPIIIALGALVLTIVDHVLRVAGLPKGITGALEELARQVVQWLTELALREEHAVGLDQRKRLLVATAANPDEVNAAHEVVTHVNSTLHAGVKDRARRLFQTPTFAAEHGLNPDQVAVLTALPDDQLDGWIREVVQAYNTRRPHEVTDPPVLAALRHATPALFATDAAEARLRAAIPGSTLPEPASSPGKSKGKG